MSLDCQLAEDEGDHLCLLALRPPELRPVLVTMPRPQVNGVCMEGKQHGDVVSAIKAGGEETKLLVVDKETDEFFKKCKVIPSHEHLHGELGGVAGGPQVRDVGQGSGRDCVPGEG